MIEMRFDYQRPFIGSAGQTYKKPDNTMAGSHTVKTPKASSFCVDGVVMYSMSPERNADIITRLERGDSLKAVAEQYGISSTRASQIHRQFRFRRGDIDLIAARATQRHLLWPYTDIAIDKKQAIEILRGLIEELPPRYQRSLTQRFGLDDGSFRSVDELAQEFNARREQIRRKAA